jgi:Ner family transcriptional regulator
MKSKGWHRADIVAAIHKRGTSLAELARDHRLGDATLRAALSYPRTPSNTIIADFLQVPLHELWPAWFDESGRLRPHDRKRSGRRPSSQKRSKKLNRFGGRT